MPTLNELGAALRAQLVEILIGGDDAVKPPAGSFISWFSPGIPFEASDFEFAAKGLGSGATAEEERRLLDQAYGFSTLVDFAPDASGLLTDEQQQTLYRSGEQRMSHMYGEILRLSRTADQELTGEMQAKLENWRSKLQVTKTVKDVETDEPTEIVEDSAMVKAYNQYQSEFVKEKLTFNAKRVAAAVAQGPEGKAAVLDWSTNAPLYRMQVTQAEGKWASVGHRADVEKLWAAIDQVTGRSMRLWRQRLVQNLADSTLTGMLPGSSFHPATIYPANFASSSGWTKYGVTSSNNTSSMREKSTDWSAGASYNMGFWSKAAGGAKSNSTTHTENMQVSGFELSFELAQATIIRPWFYPEYFKNRGWTLDAGHGWTFDEVPSDGNRPPNGLLVGYPTSIVFARNIRITSSELVTALKTFTKSLEGKTAGGWGPFAVKGSYGRSESGRDFTSQDDGQSLVVPGMQALAFINQLVPKAPNPHPDLKTEDFV